MYWGYEGMKRNLEAGAQLFKLGAASKDPQATYNYGLSLLKVSFTDLSIECSCYFLDLGTRSQTECRRSARESESGSRTSKNILFNSTASCLSIINKTKGQSTSYAALGKMPCLIGLIYFMIACLRKDTMRMKLKRTPKKQPSIGPKDGQSMKTSIVLSILAFSGQMVAITTSLKAWYL